MGEKTRDFKKGEEKSGFETKEEGKRRKKEEKEGKQMYVYCVSKMCIVHLEYVL